MPATNELLEEKSVSASGSTPARAEGDTLEELLKRNNRAFPVADVLNWADQLLDALGVLHKATPAVTHQNVRPENIVLSPDGTVSLYGAGESVSRSIGDSNLRYSPLEQIWDGLDAASQKVVTNSYDERSERTLKSPLDSRSDLYSLAATLYYSLTATQPVDALERSIEMLDGNADPLRDPSVLNSNIPTEVSQVLLKALEIKRENRFDSAAIMRQVLRASFSKVKDSVEVEAETNKQTQAAEAAKAEVRGAEEQRREAEELERKRQELEKPRPEVERAAAEGEHLLEEMHASAEPAASSDDLLELDISVMPNIEAHISAPPIDRADQDAIELSIIDEVASPAAKKPVTAAARSYSEPEKEFTYQEASSGTSMFSVPVMAAAAIVLVLVTVGIYFVAFSGSSTAPTTAVETTPAPGPAAQTNAPAANPDPIATYSSDGPQQQNAEPLVKTETGASSKAANKPGAAKESKPSAPVKEPGKEKKPVTADDLINDN